MKGAAMKLGQVMSFLDVGLVPEEYREEFQAKLAELRDAAPKVSFKDMKKVIEGEYGEHDRGRLRDLRPGADRRRLDRPGLQGAPARRPRRRGQGPVPGRRAGRPRRHAEPRDHPAADEERRAGPRPEGDGRRDPLAHRRGARLRARGAEPAHARADLPRPSVHRRARRSSRRSRTRRSIVSEFVAGPRLRGAQAAARRTSATASARSSSASTSAACTATTSSPATRTRATRCCSTTGAWRSSTSACSSASRPRSRSSSCEIQRLGDRRRRRGAHRAPARGRLHRQARALHAGGHPRAGPRHDVVVRRRRRRSR